VSIRLCFEVLSLLSGFVVADINDDIQRKQAQDRRELELNFIIIPNQGFAFVNYFSHCGNFCV
jgi:hypothetical protein